MTQPEVLAAIRAQLAAAEQRALDAETKYMGHPKDLIDRAIARAVAAEQRAEQLQVQLAGCLVAAEGGTKDSATQGMYGWSLAYQETLDLRLAFDELVRKACAADQEYREVRGRLEQRAAEAEAENDRKDRAFAVVCESNDRGAARIHELEAERDSLKVRLAKSVSESVPATFDELRRRTNAE